MRIKLVEVDVRRISRIDGLDGYAAVEVLFRRGRDPIGRARIPSHGDSLGPEQIYPFSNDLQSPIPLVLPAGPLPTVTVAICTCNGPEALASALESLVSMEYPADEVLVIDNGCQNKVQSLIEQIIPAARYIPERRIGLNFMRNSAISEATGEIIAFMDDDAEADPFWVQSLADCFAAFPDAGTVTGLIFPLDLETEARQLFEANGGFARGFSRRILPKDGRRLFGLQLPQVVDAIGVGSGCNMAFRTAALKKLHGFEEALDTGPLLPGGGDLDIFYRTMREGYEHIYEPRALVRHRRRHSHEEVRRHLAGHYRSLSAFLVKSLGAARGREWFAIFIFLIWRLSKVGFRIPGRLIGHDKLPIGLLAWLFINCILGLGSYQASKSRIRNHIRQHGGATPKLPYQLGELWRCRELVWNLTSRDLKVKYQRSWLGFIWTLLNPLVTVGVLVTVFSYFVRIPIEHYWAFLISGYFAWNFFSQTLNGGVQAAVGNAYLTRSAYFPQEAIVVSAALARMIEFLGELAIVMVFLSIFHHNGLPMSYIMVLPLVVILFLLVIGICLCVVTVAVYYNDAVQAISLATLALFYISPVFYNIDLVPERVRMVYRLNPMASILGLYHDVLYWGKIPDPKYILVTSGIALAFGLVGYTLFNLRKREFAEIV